LDLIEVENFAATSLSAARLSVPRLLPSHRARIEVAQFLVSAWPAEHRHWVRRFATGHWPLLMFLNHGGLATLELLSSNPVLAFLLSREAVAISTTLVSGKRKALAPTSAKPSK